MYGDSCMITDEVFGVIGVIIGTSSVRLNAATSLCDLYGGTTRFTQLYRVIPTQVCINVGSI